MGGISWGAARSDGAGCGGGSALDSFDKSPLEPFTFNSLNLPVSDNQARSGGRVFAAYDLDPGAYPGIWTRGYVENKEGRTYETSNQCNQYRCYSLDVNVRTYRWCHGTE
jgi:hypothetical protein